MNILAIALGGALGSVIRYVCSLLLARPVQAMPTATLFVNIVGGFILGIVVASLDKQNTAYYLLAIGFCGGFTTFSTFSMEVWGLLASGKYSVAILYILTSTILSILAFGFGLYVTRGTYS